MRADVEARRRAVLDRPWSWLRQVHGDTVVVVTSPGDGAGAVADASVTADPATALSVLTADCAPVALSSAEGVIGVVHAGWRGLLAGVVERAVDGMRALGATRIEAALGPCVHAGCYEFGAADLDEMADRFGAPVRSKTTDGKPALDLPAAVRAAIAAAGAELGAELDRCTACHPAGYFSHRARGERGRQAALVWLP